jgi:hypothetical protein
MSDDITKEDTDQICVVERLARQAAPEHSSDRRRDGSELKNLS